MNYVEEIKKLKSEKNAVIMAHYYQSADIQDIADYIGDSLALAQWAAKTDADIIVMCGVHFMGETAKILSPQKKVLVPDLSSGYARVKIDIGNGTKNYSIHKLVALLFLEPPTEGCC